MLNDRCFLCKKQLQTVECVKNGLKNVIMIHYLVVYKYRINKKRHVLYFLGIMAEALLPRMTSHKHRNKLYSNPEPEGLQHNCPTTLF